MNSELTKLQPYPFEKLRALFADQHPDKNKSAIALSIGEPKHASPDFVLQVLTDNLDKLSNYPATLGLAELRQAIADWLQKRFHLLSIEPGTQILPVNGTREALFAFAQAVIERKPEATVLCPNPFYQIYEGAAILAGATPSFLNCTQDSNYIPDFDAITSDQWQQCQLLYLCNPGNPTGAVMSLELLQKLIRLAREHDFVIASDECYSEIYGVDSAPPPAYWKLARQWVMPTTSRAWYFTAYRNAQTYPDCAPALWRVTPIFYRASSNTELIMAVQCPCITNLQASPPGVTRPTYSKTESSTSKNSRPFYTN